MAKKKVERDHVAEVMQLLHHGTLGLVALRHEDKMTFGVPDISLTGGGMTTWWEGKRACPDFKSSGQQELTMRRLSQVGSYARYIIFDEILKRTLIVDPKDLSKWATEPELEFLGFAYREVVEWMVSVHAK